MKRLSGFILSLNFKQVALVLFIIGFIIYGNTLGNDYALDDAIVINKNEFTKQGFKGVVDILSYDSFTGFFGKEKRLVDGGRYRPLSIITFAIEYQFFGQKPVISHFINVLIYCLIASLIFKVLMLLLVPKMDEHSAKYFALIASVLFILHPIHTEVVANIKGRDEELSLLFSLLAFQTVLKYNAQKRFYSLFFSCIYLFLGLMSKENSIAFFAIIPLGMYFFKKVKLKEIFIVTIPLFFASIAFLIIRHNVLGGFQQNVAGELMNNPFIGASLSQKYATIIYTWVIYFKLLVFPHPLTYDYYPYHIPIVGFSNPIVVLSVVMLVALMVLALIGLKNKSILSFSLFGFAAAFSMVSNLIFPVGTFMNERFVFMSSLFWCMGLAYLGISLYQKKKRYINILIYLSAAYVLLFYPMKTIGRNKAWKNDLTLFTTDVKTSVNSAKSNCSAGGKLWEEGKITLDVSKQNQMFAQSEKYLLKSIQIHPNYVDAWLLLGNVLFDANKDIEGASKCYIEVLKRQDLNDNAWKNVDIVLQQTDNRELQLNYYQQLYSIDSNRYIVNYRIGVLQGRYFNNLDKSVYFLKRASIIDPTKAEALKDLGTAYGIMGFEKEAYETCKRALAIDNTDRQTYINLGIASLKLGLTEESKMYFKEAERLK